MMRLRRMIYLIAALATGACMNLNVPDVTIDLGEIGAARLPGYLCVPIDTAVVTHPEDDLDQVEDNIDYNSRLLLKASNRVLASPDIFLEGGYTIALSTRITNICTTHRVELAPGVYDVVLEVWDLHGGIYHFTASVTVKGE